MAAEVWVPDGARLPMKTFRSGSSRGVSVICRSRRVTGRGNRLVWQDWQRDPDYLSRYSVFGGTTRRRTCGKEAGSSASAST